MSTRSANPSTSVQRAGSKSSETSAVTMSRYPAPGEGGRLSRQERGRADLRLTAGDHLGVPECRALGQSGVAIGDQIDQLFAGLLGEPGAGDQRVHEGGYGGPE